MQCRTKRRVRNARKNDGLRLEPIFSTSNKRGAIIQCTESRDSTSGQSNKALTGLGWLSLPIRGKFKCYPSTDKASDICWRVGKNDHSSKTFNTTDPKIKNFERLAEANTLAELGFAHEIEQHSSDNKSANCRKNNCAKFSHNFFLFRFAIHSNTNCSPLINLGAINCFVAQALTGEALQRNVRTLQIVIAKLGAGVLAKIKFGQVAVKVLGINVLVDTDKAALHAAKEAFQRIHMHVAANIFALGMIDAFMRRDRGMDVVRSLIGNEAASVVDILAEVRSLAAMIDRNRTGVSAALYKAQDNRVRALATGAALSLARVGQRGFVRLYDLTKAAQRASIAIGCHRMANTVSKVPRGFHATAEHPLKLTGRNAFFGRAKQVDRLQPQAKRQVAILENGAYPHRKRLTAGVALAKARTGRFAVQTANPVSYTHLRAHETGRNLVCRLLLE